MICACFVPVQHGYVPCASLYLCVLHHHHRHVPHALPPPSNLSKSQLPEQSDRAPAAYIWSEFLQVGVFIQSRIWCGWLLLKFDPKLHWAFLLEWALEKGRDRCCKMFFSCSHWLALAYFPNNTYFPGVDLCQCNLHKVLWGSIGCKDTAGYWSIMMATKVYTCSILSSGIVILVLICF